MAKLVYLTNVSVDGYIEDERGRFGLFDHHPDVFRFTTDVLRQFGTLLYGRRLYDTMAVWETDPALSAQSDLMAAFGAVWKAADKVVYSTSLAEAYTARTRVERTFEPAAVADLKAACDRPLTVGGADLAAQAFRSGLVDECGLFVWPMVLGGGKPAFSRETTVALELVDERRFANGTLYLHYRVLR